MLWRAASLSVLCAASVQAAGPDTKPPQLPFEAGAWEISIAMQFPGLGGPGAPSLQPIKVTRCLEQEGFIADLAQPYPGCERLQQTVRGERLTWNLRCRNPLAEGVMEGSGELTLRPTSFSGSLKLNLAGTPYAGVPSAAMTYAFNGRRVGPCTDATRQSPIIEGLPGFQVPPGFSDPTGH